MNQGFRVTNPVKTCIDLAAVLSKKGLSELVDEALRRQLFTIGELRLEMTKGRDGGAAISSLLSERGEWTTESRLEDRVYRFIVRAGLEPPVRQHEVRWRGRVMRLDFAYPQELVAIEADGYRYHSAKSNWESDLKRQNLLADLGWHVIHVTWDDVKKRPRQTLELIGRALTRSGRPSPRPNRRSGRA